MRIVVDPESLRATARTLRTAARELDYLGQQITYLDVPEMPGGQAAAIQARLRTVGATVRHSGNDLPSTADDLDRRALKAILANAGGNQKFMSYFEGKRYFHNGSDLFNTKRWGADDRFFRAEGSKVKAWGSKGIRLPDGTYVKPYRYSKTEMTDFKENGPKTDRVSAGVYKEIVGGDAAVKRWGGNGPAQLAVGEVYGTVKGGVDLRKRQAGIEAAGGANLVRGSVQFRGKHGGVEAGGSIGINGRGKAGVGFGKGNYGAEASGSVLAGGEAHASGNVKVIGVDTKATAGVSYGVGIEGEAKAGIDHGKIRVKAKIGATLGLGGNVGVDVEVDPVKTGKDLYHGGKATVKAVGGVIDSIF